MRFLGVNFILYSEVFLPGEFVIIFVAFVQNMLIGSPSVLQVFSTTSMLVIYLLNKIFSAAFLDGVGKRFCYTYKNPSPLTRFNKRSAEKVPKLHKK